MAKALFLMPLEQGALAARPNGWAPKYVGSAEFSSMPFNSGSTDSVALVLLDAPQAYLNGVASQPDALRVATPENIDSTFNANAASTAKAVFSSLFLPPSFVNQGDTRREALRKLVGLAQFSQRMEGRFGVGWRKRAKDLGLTLQTEWSAFPQALKDEFIAVRDSYGWNVSLPSPPTLENIMRVVSDQFEGEPFYIGGISI